MKLQTKPWRCGPAAVRNVLRTFGVKKSEKAISSACGTTEEGTDEHGIMSGLRTYNFSVSEFCSNNRQNAWHFLHGSLTHGYAVILCVQAWEHWVVCVGSLGDRVVVVDSSNFNYNQAENGVHVWSKKYLMYQWWNGRKSVEGQDRLYAIATRKKG